MDTWGAGVVGFLAGLAIGVLLMGFVGRHTLPEWEDEDARIVELKNKLYKLVPVEKRYEENK